VLCYQFFSLFHLDMKSKHFVVVHILTRLAIPNIWLLPDLLTGETSSLDQLSRNLYTWRCYQSMNIRVIPVGRGWSGWICLIFILRGEGEGGEFTNTLSTLPFWDRRTIKIGIPAALPQSPDFDPSHKFIEHPWKILVTSLRVM